MILGQVVGTVVATVKDAQLAGEKLLLVQLMNRKREKIGRPQAAIDVVDAGQNDFVLLVRAREAAMATYPVVGPVDLAIVGIVETADAVENIDLELPNGESFYT
ncbi:MAG: Carbon dioxide concentrating mechanism protein CcmL [Anaerolineae bacterium]|nr:Carbon dioxide concentrating mechanism protein CcmL [Anaerolineae bacterium]